MDVVGRSRLAADASVIQEEYGPSRLHLLLKRAIFGAQFVNTTNDHLSTASSNRWRDPVRLLHWQTARCGWSHTRKVNPMEAHPTLSEVSLRPQEMSETSSSTHQTDHGHMAGEPHSPRKVRESTAAAYEKDVRLVAAEGIGVPCDSEALSTYLARMRNKLSPSTLRRRLVAVRHAHHSLGLASPTDDPVMRETMRALQKGFLPDKDGTAQSASSEVTARRKLPEPSKPITRAMLARVLDAMHRSTLDYRDRALLLLGFQAALSRGELVALNVGDIRFSQDAMLVTIRVQHEMSNRRAPSLKGHVHRELAIPLIVPI